MRADRYSRSWLRCLASLGIICLLASCTSPPETIVIPTVAVLPSLTPSHTPTRTPDATETPLLPSLSPTPSRTPTPTDTLSPSVTVTITPSLTITNTPTLTRTPTPLPTQPGSLGAFAGLQQNITILPPTLRSLVITPGPSPTASPTFFITPPGPAPTFTPLVPAQPPAACLAAAPPALGVLLSTDATLSAALGCPVGLTLPMASAAQVFERGIMYYLEGPPRSIYVLTIDGRFSRFDDTWIEGVDPVSAGEVPPLGLLEPIRGFGKVWRANPAVRSALGWAVTAETGGSATLQFFERGRAVYLAERGETVIFVDEAFGQSGTWRAYPGGF